MRDLRLDSVSQADFDTVFYPGGHGPLWDLAEDKARSSLIESFVAARKPVALVCHAPGVLRHVKTPEGRPLVEGKKVAGFANTEEESMGLTNVVPFLVEDELKAKGGLYSKGADSGTLRRQRRPPDHGPEPQVVSPGREAPDRPARHDSSLNGSASWGASSRLPRRRPTARNGLGQEWAKRPPSEIKDRMVTTAKPVPGH